VALSPLGFDQAVGADLATEAPRQPTAGLLASLEIFLPAVSRNRLLQKSC
jgi:hypothetical protein